MPISEVRLRLDHLHCSVKRQNVVQCAFECCLCRVTDVEYYCLKSVNISWKVSCQTAFISMNSGENIICFDLFCGYSGIIYCVLMHCFSHASSICALVESTTAVQTSLPLVTSSSITTEQRATTSQSSTQPPTTVITSTALPTSSPLTDAQTTDGVSTSLRATEVTSGFPAPTEQLSNATLPLTKLLNYSLPSTSPATVAPSESLTTTKYFPTTRQPASRCNLDHIEFECLPDSTTVDDVKIHSSEEQLLLTDLLALMTWLADHDVIPNSSTNATGYVESYMETVDNLLDDRFVNTWNRPNAVPIFATNLVIYSQNVLTNLARSAPSEFRHVRKVRNLEFEVLKSTNVSEYCFKSQFNEKNPSTTITVKKETIDSLNVTENNDLAFTTLIARKGNLIHERYSMKEPASQVIVHSLQVDGEIVSVPVTLQMKLLQERKSNEEPLCVFLDEDKSTVQWNTLGCFADKTKDTRFSIICQCNHTTSFAVLMQLRDFKISDGDAKALEILTYLLCGLSIMGLMTTLAVFMALRSLLKSDRVTIHTNLSVALILAHFLLLVSNTASKHEIACRIVTLLMHYFFLAVFCWMLVEGVHLYFQIVRVFSSGMDRRKPYMVIGWGTPCVIVIITAASRWDDYINPDSCWLSTENNVIWAFVGPALAIILVNAVVLGLVVRIIVTSAAANKDKEYDHIKGERIVVSFTHSWFDVGFWCATSESEHYRLSIPLRYLQRLAGGIHIPDILRL
ncbi:adhesion G-protein coupled receptor D1-like isoform X2 [Acanthaster planci]|uniref:Adhesion G-protein coupled receptor D1-like isoform X2 n=1 Tax=Acanthaster planci TaxID=133434 RepID=A0A8B7ZJM0_ACAPL|nr:adhesion G-protein coupled receptor D1-like isoform X2 [Acanthaster planci]